MHLFLFLALSFALDLGEADPTSSKFSIVFLYEAKDKKEIYIKDFKDWTPSNESINLTCMEDQKQCLITLQMNDSISTEVILPKSTDSSMKYDHILVNITYNSTYKSNNLYEFTVYDENYISLLSFSTNTGEINSSLPDNFNKIQITISNDLENEIDVIKPEIFLYRMPTEMNDNLISCVYKDIIETCTITLNKSFGAIELETKRIHQENQQDLLKYNIELNGTNSSVAILPFIRNEQGIIGVDLSQSSFSRWYIKKTVIDGNDYYSFATKIKPLHELNVSINYYPIQNSNFEEALEIWYNAFKDYYGLPPKLSGQWHFSQSSECNIDSSSPFLWNSTGFKQFDPFTLECHKDSNCNELKEKFCIKKNNINCDNQILWSNEIAEFQNIPQKIPLALNYSGIFGWTTNINDDIQFVLIDDNGFEFYPVDESFKDFLFYKNTENMIGADYILPTYISKVASLGTYIDPFDDKGNFIYNSETRLKLWTLRYLLGSKSLNVISHEIIQKDHIKDFLAICLSVGAFPAFIPGKCNDEMKKVLKGPYTKIFTQILNYTEYYPYGKDIVSTDDTTSDYFNSSSALFCEPEKKDTKNSITCYDIILINSESKSLQIITKTEDKVDIYFEYNTTYDFDTKTNKITIKLQDKSDFGICIVSIVHQLEFKLEDWVKQNIWLVVVTVIVAIVVLISVGYGIYFLFGKKQAEDSEIGRIYDLDKKHKKEREEFFANDPVY